MNERDSEEVKAMLHARGYVLVDSERECDVMLLNTCAVRDVAELKAIGKAGRLGARKRKGERLVVGVMGCMAQNRGRKLLESLPDLDLIAGTQRFHRVAGYVDALTGRGGVAPSGVIVDLNEEEGSQELIRDHYWEGAGRRASAFVSIQQGCNMRCAFCIVPKVRGDERSRRMEEIVREVEVLASEGVKEVTLLGQIVTSYGRRDYAGVGGVSPFVQLLEKVCAVEGVERVRFTSPHPCGFKEDLVEAFGRLPKLGEYVHLPMQSGSDRILRAMNRPYSKAAYRELVRRLGELCPGMHFSTDVIVGFPGETEEDFEETVELFGECDFDMAYVFKYSPRSGTPAAELGDAVPEEVKERRNQVLLEMLRGNSLRRNALLVGQVQEVLVEGKDKTGERLVGRTRGNRVAILEGGEELAGRLVKMRVERATVSSLYGEIVEG